MFDLTTTTTDVQTMTSRDIAELTGKLHKNVLRDIESIGSVLSQSSKSVTYAGYNNQQQREWHLTKRDTLLVISGYNVELRARIIDRWEELEQKQQVPALNLNDPKQLLGLLQNYAERTLELENKVVVQEEVIAITSQQLEEAAPKVEFVDKYVEASGLLGFREVAKMLGVKEAVLRAWLVDTGAMYRLGAGWTFKAQWLYAKRGVHKISYDVYGRAVVSAKFTPKGFAYIAERISK